MKTFGQLKLLIPQGCYLIKPKLFLAESLITLGVLAGSYHTALAQGVETKAGRDSIPSAPPATSALSSLKQINNHSLNNGVYLYGESAKPEQIQQEYFVFEVENNTVVGAFYMPHSSYDCFYGTLQAQKLDLNIISTYDEDTYTHSVNLQEYQPISSVSSNDQQILYACKTVYQTQGLSNLETEKPLSRFNKD